MARPLRIAYPDAWYHVMNRGRRAEKIFIDTQDYQAFVELLKETSEAWNIRISAYCLMPNHYHMLTQTPEANISRAMRHINGVYTQRFNSRHKCDGQLFRGRYRSILVGGDSYLLQLVRYIHRNPLKSRLVKNLNAYAWSSHKAYVSIAQKWNWLHKDFILNILTSARSQQIRVYRRFVAVEDEDKTSGIMEGKRWPSLLGPQDFINWVKTVYRDFNGWEEIPRIRDLYADPDRIFSRVCDYYGVKNDDLFISKRGYFNEPRCVAIYLMRRLRRDSLGEIGKAFQMKKYSSVSSVVARLKMQMRNDFQLEKRVKEIENLIIKSQEQTPKHLTPKTSSTPSLGL